MRVAGRYFAVFLGATVPFGGVMGVPLAGFAGWTGVAVGLLLGAAFGVLMTVVLGGLDVVGQRRVGDGASRSGSPRQRLVLLSQASPAALASRLREAVFTLHAQVESDALPHGPLRARTGTSWASWGETVTVELHPAPDGRTTEVVLQSRPVMRATLVDYGKGRSNVNHLARALE